MRCYSVLITPGKVSVSLFDHDYMFAFIQFILIKYNKSQSFISILSSELILE